MRNHLALFNTWHLPPVPLQSHLIPIVEELHLISIDAFGPAHAHHVRVEAEDPLQGQGAALGEADDDGAGKGGDLYEPEGNISVFLV